MFTTATFRLPRAVPLLLGLPFLLTACFWGNDKPDPAPTPPFVVVPSEGTDCKVISVTPTVSVTNAFINPLLTVNYSAPNLDVCNRMTLQDATHATLPTRVVAANEWAHPRGGVAGRLTLEPVADLAPNAQYGLLLAGQTISFFKTGTERRGNLVAVEDQPLRLPRLPASARVGSGDINGILDVVADDLTKGQAIERAVLETLLKVELKHLASPNARFGARVSKLTYRSSNAIGAPVTLSGLLVYPAQDGTGPAVDYNGLPMVIGQRGASDNDGDAPSSGAHILTVLGLLAAGKGHVFIAPDLIGMGDTKSLPQAYLVASQAAEHTQNMLRAAREYFRQQLKAELGRDLRILGASEGGFTTVAALPHLSLDSNVRLVSAAEGPYDVFHTFDSNILAVGGAARDGYSRDEDLSLVASRTRSAMESVSAYQNFKFDPAKVFAADGSLLPSFLQDYKDGKHPDLMAQFGLNSLASGTQRYDLPNARVSLYHFTTDALVPSQNTVDMVARLNLPPNRLGSLERGNCRQDSVLTTLVMSLSSSKLKTHTVCVPYQIDDFVADL
ncbi:hypothetical protein [Roseateles amylovorans]|uniref:SbsA Ig-like domain-containing protein n=1 Tax=Roseateles amylovorans TaxID=2978473 RepID=A0ABY6AUH5_9BURK|nr:hypothetical protein [Roseateles amylovorans]UXH76871.1 hypothetical protein N4261_17790 [Roseateles amylovorans]